MKTIKQHLKVVALFLSALMLLQGCTTYRSANVTLEEAVSSQTKVKVETKDNRTLKFDRIGNDGDGFYGVRQVKNVNQQIPLEENEVNVVRLKNKEVSTLLSIAIILGSAAVLAVLIIAMDYKNFVYKTFESIPVYPIF